MITAIAGTGTAGYSGDGGAATFAKLYYPNGIAVDLSLSIYIADQYNPCVRFINATTGVIITIAGTGASGYSGDGGAATSTKLKDPTGVFVDSLFNMYIIDRSNNLVRFINATTGMITTIAWTSTSGHSGDGGAATSARLKHPYGIAVDSSLNVYIADQYNHCFRRLLSPTLSPTPSPTPNPTCDPTFSPTSPTPSPTLVLYCRGG